MSAKAFDYKKEYKDLYLPKDKPVLIEVPPMQFIMADGSGDPNGGHFQQAVELLYGLTYTVKMSKMKGNQPEGYFEYVVPPLEGLWWIDEGGFSFEKRENWKWTVMIRQPEFVDAGVFQWACSELQKKKPELNPDNACFGDFEEGLCVQIMHMGPYAEEPRSMDKMTAFMEQEGLRDMVGAGGKHHEIYLSDPRKGKPENMKTVLRHPVAGK
ncbi:MAG: GyrI-like domain-containing protein [Bacillota bacterium]